MVMDSIADKPCNVADIAATVTSVIKEEREKDKQKLNIIVHNLNESEDEDPSTENFMMSYKSQILLGSI